MRFIVATVVLETLKAMDPQFPEPDQRLLEEIEKAKVQLVAKPGQNNGPAAGARSVAKQ